MTSRLELILGHDFNVPASPYAKKLVVIDAAPQDTAAGYAHGSLWVNATSGAVHVNTGTEESATWTEIGASGSATAAKTATDFIAKADSLPAKADFIGQLFVRTGNTDPGLYVSTGTTTPGWKAVSHAS